MIFSYFTNDNLHIEVNFLNTKDNIKNAFIKYKAVDENLSGKEIKFFLTDYDLECCSKEFNIFKHVVSKKNLQPS